MTSQKRTSQAGLDLIKAYEGFRSCYEELPDGRWIIGYGHIRSARENVQINHQEAEAILREYDLPDYERTVRQSVLAPLNQNEFDALVSLAFNIGRAAFAGSNVVYALNGGHRLMAASAFDSWRRAEIGGRVQIVDALVRRRASEKALFLKTIETMPIAPSGYCQALMDPSAKSDLLALRKLDRDQADRFADPEGHAHPTEAAAENFRLQMEDILQDIDDSDDDLWGHDLEAATPEDITAAVSELAEDDRATVRKSVWPDHTGLSPPPAYERELTRQRRTPRKSWSAVIDNIDDQDEFELSPDHLTRAVAENERREKTERRTRLMRAVPYAGLALLGAVLMIVGGLDAMQPDADQVASSPLSAYLPGFVSLLGFSLLCVMGYYCYHKLGYEE